MKKSLIARVGGALIVALGLALALGAVPVFAAVVRSTEDHTGNFTKDAKIGTVSINTADMTAANPNLIFSSTNQDVKLDKDTTRTMNCIVWAPNGTGDDKADTVSIASGTDKSVSGTHTLTWPGIATLQDGSTADVTMTITDLYFDKPYKNIVDSSGTVTSRTDADACGPIGFFSRTGFIGPSFTLGSNVGMTCKINVKVTQNGSSVSGTTLFSTVDLDVSDPRYGGTYKESFRVDGGDVDDIFVPSDSILDIDEATKKFTRTATDENTYKTGFVVLTDAGSGIDLTWWGQGNGMGTKLFTGNISHHIDSSTGTGGSIKTTTSGKVGEGDELGPVRAEVPDGKDISYLMEPDDGYKLDKITIDGQVVDPDDSSTWPNFIEITKDANGNPIVTFKDNDANHTIDVQWKRVFSVTFEDGDHGTSDGNGNETEVPEGDYPKGGNGVTANSGYEFSGTYKYVITKPDGTTEEGETDDPTSIEVTGDIVFTPIYNPIVTATSGTGGSISDPGDTAVKSGSSKTYTFTPEAGYTVGTVTVNGQEVTPVDNGDGTWSYTLENVTEPTTIDVQWKKTYTVTFTDGANGTSEGGDQTGVPEGEYPEGGNTVTPNKGYRFTGTYKYVITHDDGTTEEGETDDPASIEVTGDIVFTPVYQKVITVTYVDPATGRIIQDTITIDDGDPEPSAPANPTRTGYIFKGWKRTVDADGNIIYEAIWEPIPAKRAVPKVAKPLPHTGDVLSAASIAVLAGGGFAAIAGALVSRKKDEK